jgi:hypothetical protein
MSLAAGRAEIAGYVADLRERPGRHGANVIALDSGAGLANATLQLRVTVVRLFYDFLVEEQVRERNPVARGYRSADGRAGRRGLVARVDPLPWIPTDAQWRAILDVAAGESLRNRLMLALATTLPCAARSCVCWRPMISIRRTGRSRSGRRRRRVAAAASFRTRPCPASCWLASCGIAGRSRRHAARCSCPSHHATAVSGCRRGRGRKLCARSRFAPRCRRSVPTRSGTCAWRTSPDRGGSCTGSRRSPGTAQRTRRSATSISPGVISQIDCSAG